MTRRTGNPPSSASGMAGEAPAASPTGAAPPYDAVIFDMDGVVTDTAAMHAAAWKQLFDDVLADPRAGTPQAVPFDLDLEYRRYVDGRVREDVLTRTVDYYLARTAHGSTLSRVVHASVLARLDPSRAWSAFRDALTADLDDTQGGTTEEGIHLGAMAGTIDLVTRSFAGLQIQADTLTFTPRLPDQLQAARFQIQYRGHRIDVSIDHARLRLAALPSVAAAEVRIEVAGSQFDLGGDQTLEVPLRRDS